MQQSRVMQKVTWVAGGVAAASCLTPWILGLVGLGALGVTAASAESVALSVFGLGTAALFSSWLARKGAAWWKRGRPPADEDGPPLACDLSAIDGEDRPAHEENARTLFGEVEDIRETTEGYAFRLPARSDMLVLAAKFISLERLCCPFLRFSLRAGAGREATWLELGGTPRVKQYVHDHIVQRMATDCDRGSC